MQEKQLQKNLVERLTNGTIDYLPRSWLLFLPSCIVMEFLTRSWVTCYGSRRGYYSFKHWEGTKTRLEASSWQDSLNFRYNVRKCIYINFRRKSCFLY